MTLESGQVLAARYALERRLGDGGTAEVWLARDGEARCVVKVLRAEPARQPAECARFVAGARLQRSTQHPNVLACIDVVESDPPFAVFSFESATDLARMRGAPLPQLVTVLSQVAAGLGALHARGHVHRDIKSSNVLMTDDGRVLLADFGLAAAIGDATATAGGSPFTSSPEQLAGGAPSIADDVYGFGALAFELVTGYPPFYPDAAAARTAAEPPRLGEQRNGVPAELEDLVTRCLARNAADRPRDVEEISTALARMAVAADVRDAGRTRRAAVALRVPDAESAAIEPRWQRAASSGPSAAELRSQGFRRGLLAGSFVFLLVVAGLTFFVLPEWVQRNEPVVAAPPPAMPAKPPQPAVTPPAKDPQAEAQRARRLKAEHEQQVAAQVRAALAAGAAAIDAGDSAEAQRQYGIAASLDPANAAARRGLKRAGTLDEVRTLLAQAAEAERTGRLADAERAWGRALELDPDTTAAREALARVRSQQAAGAFSAAVADGLAALSRKDYAAARAAYERAGRIRPGAPEVKEGLEQVDRALGDRTIAQHLDAARRAEGEERWRDALAEYRAALMIDPNLLDAQRGVERVEPRVMLDAALASYLERPERLFSSEVRGAARATLAQAGAIASPGPVLTRQMTEVSNLLAAAETPVRLTIASDNVTEVTIYRVGRLGAFEHKDMDLLPGRYTVLGTRAGFRDVRREVTIVPGKQPPQVVIRCEEQI